MWNGFSMISKRPELTEGMMQTLVEAERTLLEAPGIAALFQIIKQGKMHFFFMFAYGVRSILCRERVHGGRPLCGPHAEGSLLEESRSPPGC